MVVLRLDLDEIETDEIEAPQSAHEPERIAAAWPADFRRPRPRRESRIDEVDVEAEKDRALADPREHLRQHSVDTALQQRLGRDQVKAERARTVPIFGAVQRTPDAQLHRPRGLDQTLLDRAAAPGAVGVALAPVVVPGIGVGIEIDQADRPVALGDRPQLSQRDRMVSSDGERNDLGSEDRAEPFVDHFVRGLHVPGDHGEIARVDGGHVFEDLDVLLDVVRPQQSRRLADGRRRESTADPIGDRRIERDAEERRVHAIHVGDVGKAHECPDAGEPRSPHRVDRPVARRATDLRHRSARTPRP